MNCNCIFHDFAIFTRVHILPPEFLNRFKCVKIAGNDVVVSAEATIGEKIQWQPIELQNRNNSVEQNFLEVCSEMEQSHYRMNICYENAASLLIDEPPTNLHARTAEFIGRMIDAYMPLGILNSTGLRDARNVLNEIRQSLNQPNNTATVRFLMDKSNQFYQMIPHIEFNLVQPRKLPQINTTDGCRNKTELIDHIEAVSTAIQTGRQMENRSVLEFIYHNFMKVELKPILSEDSDYRAFTRNFNIDLRFQPIKFLFSTRKPFEPNAFTAENTIGNVYYLFHSTHSANLIDILREGLRVAPKHVFSYNRWYGLGIYFYGHFSAALSHADRLKHKIILVCRVALGNVEIFESSGNNFVDSNVFYRLQSGKNSLRVLGLISQSAFAFNEGYGAYLPPNSVVRPMEMLNIRGKTSYCHNDEFLVQHKNQVKIEYIIELKD